MSLISIFGCAKKSALAFPQDTVTAADGSPITLTFFQHASLAIDWNGRRIYVDTVGEGVDWAKLPKADAILITHSHYDHVGGVDDLRPFCVFGDIDVYADPISEKSLRQTVPYCFAEHLYPGVPKIKLHQLNPHQELH